MKTENIIGLGVLGVGGYFLYEQLTKDKDTSSSFGGGSGGSVGNVNAGYSSEDGSNKTGESGDTIIKIVSDSNLKDGETKKTATTKDFVQTSYFKSSGQTIATADHQKPLNPQTMATADHQAPKITQTKKETKSVFISPLKIIGGLFSKK